MQPGIIYFKNNDINADFESYMNDIIHYEKYGYIPEPISFIGHCCLIDIEQNKHHDTKLQKRNEKGMVIRISLQ